MKILRLITVSLFFLSASVYAQSSYLAFEYGTAETSSDALAFDGIDGSVMGVTYGTHTSQNFAWELSARKTDFDEQTTTVDLTALGGGVVSVSSEISALVLGGGFRWTILRFFSVKAGLGYSSVDPQVTSNNNNIPASEEETGLGIYYGAGAQLPMGMIDIYADYTSNSFSGDISSTEMSAGLRLRF